MNDDNQNSFVGSPNTICTETFLVVGANLNLDREQADNLSNYLRTKFARYLLSLAISSNIKVNISVEIENAIKQVEDACLPSEQEKEVLAKIQELKEIVESKESRKSKWTKIGGFFKWVAEQGIQVASIIVPLLANTIKG